jgi:uncharacterized protein
LHRTGRGSIPRRSTNLLEVEFENEEDTFCVVCELGVNRNGIRSAAWRESGVKLFIDTWGWLVLEDSKDPQHQAASRIYAETAKAAGNIFTTNFVLDETFSRLFRRRPFEEASRFAKGLLESPFIGIEEITRARFRRAFDLRLTFRDKPDISFTDLTSMAVVQELKIVDILTGDRHFIQAGLGFRTHPKPREI